MREQQRDGDISQTEKTRENCIHLMLCIDVHGSYRKLQMQMSVSSQRW